jgi:putative ABC transport system permease protein
MTGHGTPIATKTKNRGVMETVLQDLHFGVRLLRKNPGFTLIAAIALALGIAANSAVFSLINALLLKPLPFEHLNELVIIRESLPNQGLKATAVSPGDFVDWREQNTVFQKIAAYRIRDINILSAGEPEVVRGSFVTSDFFRVLKAHAIQGRTPTIQEDQPGGDQVAVLGHGLWKRVFASDPSVIGKTMTLNDRAFMIIGIMPKNFDFPYGTEVWAPLALTSEQKILRDVRNLYVIAHLKTDVTVAEAQAQVMAIAKRIEQKYPNTNTGLSVNVVPLQYQQAEFTRPMLSILLGMAMLLLLIGCVNVANLLLVRATTRQKEMAIRAALSASRWRVIRQLITESFLLAALAGMFGLLLSIWAVDLIKASLPPDIAKFMAGWKEISINGRVLAFTFVVSLLTTALSSLAPAFHASRMDLSEALKEGDGFFGRAWRGSRMRNFLVMSEIALALVLLVGAGLMVKGFWQLLNAHRGANPESILTMQTSLPESRYKDPRKMGEFYQQVLSRLKGMQELQTVTVASNTPLNNSPNPSVELIVQGRAPNPRGERRLADLMLLGSNYFNMIGAHILKGRDFTESDDWEAPRVAIISEMTSQRYWPGEDGIGKRFKIDSSGDTPWIQVVGIVNNVKQSWFDKEIRPQLYLPYLQRPRAKMSLLLRTSGDPSSLIPDVRDQIHAIDKNQPIEEIKTLAQVYKDEISPLRFAAVLMFVIGGVALILSAIGVYGVMSFSVEQRTREIGIRNALGAQPSDLLHLILSHGMRITGIGLLIGFPLAMGLSRMMANLLYGIVALEYVVLIGFFCLLAITAFLASYIPALRAARVDPIVSLRYQ